MTARQCIVPECVNATAHEVGDGQRICDAHYRQIENGVRPKGFPKRIFARAMKNRKREKRRAKAVAGFVGGEIRGIHNPSFRTQRNGAGVEKHFAVRGALQCSFCGFVGKAVCAYIHHKKCDKFAAKSGQIRIDNPRVDTPAPPQKIHGGMRDALARAGLAA